MNAIVRTSAMQLPRENSPFRLAKNVGPVVYFARTKDDLIKIGYTEHLYDRARNFGSWGRLLAIHPGTLQDEHAAHERFTACLARGREYFHPFPELITYINEIRDAMGVPVLVW